MSSRNNKPTASSSATASPLSAGGATRRPVTATIVAPLKKKPLATITNHQQPRKMDYNPAAATSNYHCHQSAAGAGVATSPKSKLLAQGGGGGDSVATITTKGPKLKALPGTTINAAPITLNGGGHQQQRSPVAAAGDSMNHHNATNGHQQHHHHHHHPPQQQQQHIRESLENVMPSNNLHSAHNLSNNSQRYFTSQVLCNENGTKRDHHHNQQQQQSVVGILKGKILEEEENDNNYQEDRSSSTNVQMRRIRGRSESTEPADAYFASNGRNAKAAGGAAGLMNGTVCPSSSIDINLKRSREDSSASSVAATGYNKSPSGSTCNGNGHKPEDRRSTMTLMTPTTSNGHSKGILKYSEGLFIEDLKANGSGGECDKELVSPPAKVISKLVCNAAAVEADQSRALSTTTNGKFVEAHDSELLESEYSSLDDEEDDEFAEDGETSLATTTGGDFIGEDVFDAMTAEEEGGSSANGKTAVRQLPKPISGCVLGGTSATAPFSRSLFPNVPLYFSFANYLEAGPALPPCITKIMKWKLTPVTPVVVRKVLINTGFRLLKQTNDWMGIWGKHMKSPQFRTIRSYQKYNHIPGSFQIGRKDRVWRNLENQIRRNGKKEFGFMPRTYILPQDLKCLRQMWPKYSQQNVKWIIKPPASARGVGIKVVNRWSQIPKRKPIIVQRYVERPFLIQGNKFDLRLYVLVTSINPLRIYLHNDGLARFASVRYSEKADTLSDRFMHLTNYSINKLSANYAKNEDADQCQGHKWTLRSLWQYLEAADVNTERLWGLLRNLIIRTLLAGETPINNLTKANILSKYNCFELFGFDVLLDADLNPWLLEVNISPSLHSASPLDLRVKAPLVQAVLNTAMYQVPPKLAAEKQQELLEKMGLPADQMLCHDKRIYTTQLNRVERVKHNKFVNKDLAREEYLDSILEELTSDDVRCLINTEDELARCAPLERIFPAPNTHVYLDFTESPRYYNRLLDAWETKYSKRRPEAIELLREQCERKIHLQVPPHNASARKDSNNKSSSSSSIPATPSTASSSSALGGGSTAALGQQHRRDGGGVGLGLVRRQQQQQEDPYYSSSGPPSESYRESSVESISTTTSTLSESTTNLPMSSSLSAGTINSSSSQSLSTTTGTNAIKTSDSFSFSSMTSLSQDEKTLNVQGKSPFYNKNIDVPPKGKSTSGSEDHYDENINTENGL